jgi:hypothetical protein
MAPDDHDATRTVHELDGVVTNAFVRARRPR